MNNKIVQILPDIENDGYFFVNHDDLITYVFVATYLDTPKIDLSSCTIDKLYSKHK